MELPDTVGIQRVITEEFGEERLIESTRQYRCKTAGETLDGIIGEVQRFSQGEQADDMTLIVARCV